ncbi:UDP-4-amino-4,6-dideoxy-N-acetyl-beta-L-altrosamine N-acetyltransferase [Aliarcobacter butzleri]
MKDIKLINFIDLSFEEKKMILEWRNNPNIQKWMYTQDEISLENHLKFIDSLKISKDKLYFLVQKNNENIGVINFTNLTENNIYFGLYANPVTKILGVGRILEEISIDFAFNTLKIKKLKLEVFEDNIQVRNLHKKYKFKENAEKFINNKKVICMELNYENMHSCSHI